MLTASGDTLGSWNGLRPIIINNTSGAVSIGNGLNVTGGVNGSLNGNASTATKLQTARNINGVKFDGSGDININTLVSRGRVTALSGSTQGTAGIQMYEAYNNSYPTMYGNVLHMKVRVLLVRRVAYWLEWYERCTCASFHSLTKRYPRFGMVSVGAGIYR